MLSFGPCCAQVPKGPVAYCFSIPFRFPRASYKLLEGLQAEAMGLLDENVDLVAFARDLLPNGLYKDRAIIDVCLSAALKGLLKDIGIESYLEIHNISEESG